VPLPGRDATVDLLSDLPFTVASLSSYSDVWETEYDYTPPSFADGQLPFTSSTIRWRPLTASGS